MFHDTAKYIKPGRHHKLSHLDFCYHYCSSSQVNLCLWPFRDPARQRKMGGFHYWMSYQAFSTLKILKWNMIEQSRYWYLYFGLVLGAKISRTKFLDTFRVEVFQVTIPWGDLVNCNQKREDCTKIPVLLEAFCFYPLTNICFESFCSQDLHQVPKPLNVCSSVKQFWGLWMGSLIYLINLCTTWVQKANR